MDILNPRAASIFLPLEWFWIRVLEGSYGYFEGFHLGGHIDLASSRPFALPVQPMHPPCWRARLGDGGRVDGVYPMAGAEAFISPSIPMVPIGL